MPIAVVVVNGILASQKLRTRPQWWVPHLAGVHELKVRVTTVIGVGSWACDPGRLPTARSY